LKTKDRDPKTNRKLGLARVWSRGREEEDGGISTEAASL